MSRRAPSTDVESGETVNLSDVTLGAAEQVRVFLDGVDKGLTPRSLRVDRRFGFSEILLRKGKERVRLFEIDQTTTSNANALAYTFGLTSDGYYLTLYAEELPKKRNSDSHYYIPYTTQPLLITDRMYGLEIIIY